MARLTTEKRQLQISEAALEIVNLEGLKRLSIANIAKKIDVAPSAVYRHFRSKDQIISAVLHLVDYRLSTNIERVKQEESDPIDQLHYLLRHNIEMIQKNRAIPRIIFSDEVVGGKPEKRDLLYRVINGHLSRIAEIISQGQEEGSIRKDFKPETLTVFFMGLIQPAAIIWHLSDGKFDIAEHAKNAWKYFKQLIQV